MMLHLKDERGWFQITAANEIIRMDQPGFAPSGQWLFVGIVRQNNFGHTVERLTANDVRTMARKGEYSLKGEPCDAATFYFLNNGKARWHVRDYDHGAQREWGSGVEQFYLK